MRAKLPRPRAAWFLPVVLAGIGLVYLPNLSGAFVLDDYPNFVANPAARPSSLDPAEWLDALLSGRAGPSGRPIAMLSFALNDYPGGGLEPARFKAVNLFLHLLCGLLAWRLVLGLLRRLPHCPEATARFAAAGAAAIWVLHPIHLTVVLYAVQRMAALSALFCLAGMWCYLSGRVLLARGRRGAVWRIAAAFLLCTPLAALSKENGVLLPVYLLLIELFFFRAGELARRPRMLLRAAFACAVILPAAAAGAWLGSHWHALEVGPTRAYEYGPGLRLLTEARILWQYLGMILIPAAHRFTLFHDQVAVSHSLFSPWTTLPAALGIAGLAVACGWLRGRAPVAGFGIALFLAGHLLESTVLPLEPMFEHRNYLPSLGPLCIVAYTLSRSRRARATLQWGRIALPVLAAACAVVAWPRAEAWGRGVPHMTLYELRHHPRSPGLHRELAAYYVDLLERQPGSEDAARLYRLAVHHLRRCAAEEPRYPSCIGYQVYSAMAHGRPVDPAWLDQIAALLQDAPLRPMDVHVLGWLIHSCEQDCSGHDRRMDDYRARLRGNPNLAPYGHRGMYMAFADYYLRRRGEPAPAWQALVRGTATSLSRARDFDTREKLGKWLAEAGLPGLALEELDALSLGYPWRARTRSFLDLHADTLMQARADRARAAAADPRRSP